MRAPDNNEPDHDDLEATQIIAIPVDALGSEHASADVDIFDDEESPDRDAPEGEIVGEDDTLDDEPMSPLLRGWRRGAEYVTAGEIRRHALYAAAAGGLIIAVVAVVITTSVKSKSAEDVTDTASSSEGSATQSFDDITQLLQGGLGSTTTMLETSVASSVSGIPVDVPLPGEIPAIDPGSDQAIAPATVTVTDSAPVQPISGDSIATETTVVTETVAPSTITETPTAGQWPSLSINGSVSVQPRTYDPGRPSTVTVVVPVETTAPKPSTVTVVVPATTTAPATKSSTPKPSGCPTTTEPGTKTTTAPPTTTRPPVTPSPPRMTMTPSATTKSTTTTTTRPCK
ncbi:hypothetical protein ACWIGW_16445 [Nocardia brasiliensis]